jgi:hypothetical protein
MSNTAAYNANEVAAVYMSFDRSDLLSTDEGGTGNLSDSSLRNGFYGLSDPLNLRGTLQRFECDFTRGSNSAHYRVRIINPTTELEDYLIAFYGEVFPAKMSSFEQYHENVQRDRDLNAVDDTRFEVRGILPVLYLRFGYGTSQEQGLSRIHKTVLNDIKYIVQENADKVLELQLTDQFTYSQVNRSFNQRPFVEKVSVLNEDKTLKRPSEILAEVLEGYTNAYPQCRPMIDLASYGEPIDNLTFSLAAALAKKDKTSELVTTEIATESGYNLTEEERENIEELLDRPITSKLGENRKADGTITISLLRQAYKLIFEQIGMTWKAGDKEITPGVILKTAQNQLNALTYAVEYPENESATLQTEDSNVKTDENTLINIQTEFLQTPFLDEYTQRTLTSDGSDPYKNALGFYPQVLAMPEPSSVTEETYKVANITNITLSSVDLQVFTDIKLGAPPNFYGTNENFAPPLSPIESQPTQALVIQMDEDVLARVRPLTQYVQNDLTERFSNQLGYGGVPVIPSYELFDGGTGQFYTPKWYTLQARPETQSLQNTQELPPLRIRLDNIQGMEELNGKTFVLFSPDGFGQKPEYTGKYLLVQEEWYNANSVDILQNEFPSVFPGITKFAGDDRDTAAYSPYTGAGEVFLADPFEDLSPSELGELRTPTASDKERLENEGNILYLNAGVVNEKNYRPMGESPDKYVFSLAEVDQLVDGEEVIRAEQEGDNSINLQKLEVNIPTINDFVTYRQNTVPSQPFLIFTPHKGGLRTRNPLDDNRFFVGDSAFGIPDPNQGPVYNMDEGRFVSVSGNEWQSLPDPYHTWYSIANFAWKQSLGFPEPTIGSIDAADLETLFPDYCNNMPLVPLEPTIDTATWLNFLQANTQQLRDINKALDEQQEAEFQQMERDRTGVAAPEEEPKTRPTPITNSFVYMGTTDNSPHITGVLKTVINGLNKLIIGQSSKMEVIPIEVSKLSPEDKKWLKENDAEFKNTTWDEIWADKNFTLLKVAPTEATSKITDALIRPILSFPQTNYPLPEGDFYAPNKRNEFNRVMFLDYGTPGSLVAKVEFQGDTRVLVNMAGANYAVRQWNDIADMFGGDGPTREFVYQKISEAVSNKLQLMRKAAVQTGQSFSELENTQEFKFLLDVQSKLPQDPDNPESEFIMDLDIVKVLPDLLDFLPSDVDKAAGADKDLEELKILASVVQNDQFLSVIFPDDDISGKTNTRKTETVVVETTPDGTAVKKREKVTTVLPRKVDFSQIYNRIGDAELLKKMSDFKFSYYNAMAQEVFEIKLTTLGIPEIDDIATEFLSRLVVFQYKDVRFGTGQNHWMSGVYRINGFKHRIDPAIGFVTEFSLYKDIEYNITKVGRR